MSGGYGMESAHPRRSMLKSILLTIPGFLIVWMMILQGGIPGVNLDGAAKTAAIVFVTAIFFLMIRTGDTYKYRKVLFVVAAVCFPVVFISNYIEVRGSMSFGVDEWMSSNVPFCHLVIPMVIIPAALTNTIIFPGSLFEGFANISSMFVIWIGVSLALGRGWCSWVCFYGGLDDGFTYFSRKRKLKIDPKWTYLPWAVLIAVVLTSTATLSPTYCEWICPFKAVTEYAEVVSVKTLIQMLIFGSLFIALVIVGPILTGKRTQCSLLCPFAAFQSLTNKVNVFDIRIDTEKCTKCKVCIDSCPTLSIDAASRDAGKTLSSCTKCGKCVDQCYFDAASFHIKGTKVGARTELARGLFLYTAFVFAAAMGGGFIYGAVLRFLNLLTTGSMI